MNSMLSYVITRYINPLVMGPWYLRWSIPVLVAFMLSFLLVNKFVINLWESSRQIDLQMAQINSKLALYQSQRERINDDYEKLTSASRLIEKLEIQFSQATSESVESWLIQASMENRLRTSQVRINTQLSDDRGEFFRITFKIGGSASDIESFLQAIMNSDYFLIWEKLIFENLETNRLSLTIVLKQYVSLYGENPVTS